MQVNGHREGHGLPQQCASVVQSWTEVSEAKSTLLRWQLEIKVPIIPVRRRYRKTNLKSAFLFDSPIWKQFLWVWLVIFTIYVTNHSFNRGSHEQQFSSLGLIIAVKVSAELMLPKKNMAGKTKCFLSPWFAQASEITRLMTFSLP